MQIPLLKWDCPRLGCVLPSQLFLLRKLLTDISLGHPNRHNASLNVLMALSIVSIAQNRHCHSHVEVLKDESISPSGHHFTLLSTSYNPGSMVHSSEFEYSRYTSQMKRNLMTGTPSTLWPPRTPMGTPSWFSNVHIRLVWVWAAIMKSSGLKHCSVGPGSLSWPCTGSLSTTKAVGLLFSLGPRSRSYLLPPGSLQLCQCLCIPDWKCDVSLKCCFWIHLPTSSKT